MVKFLIFLALLGGCAAPPSIDTSVVPPVPVWTKPKPYWSDEAIAAKIKAGLNSDIELKLLPIQVDTKSGEVTLKGAVRDEGQARRAVAIAGSVPGVKRVKNNLVIK